jgi:hypothetical protein
MKEDTTMRRLLAIILTVAACAAPSYAQPVDLRVFSFDRIDTESEPGMVQIVMVGRDGKKAVLRMDFIGAQNLAAQLEKIGN